MSEVVTIHVLDREFTVGCAPEAREGLLAAARMLDERMRAIREGNRMASIDRIAVMAALNMAHELQEARAGGASLGQEFERALGDVERRLERLPLD